MGILVRTGISVIICVMFLGTMAAAEAVTPEKATFSDPPEACETPLQRIPVRADALPENNLTTGSFFPPTEGNFQVSGGNPPSSLVPAKLTAPEILKNPLTGAIPGGAGLPGETGPDPGWTHYVGGSGYEEGWAIVRTGDDGILLTGYTDSSDGDFASAGYHGGSDAFLARMNATGTVQWATCIGGSGYEGSQYSGGLNAGLVSNGGFIVVGYTESGDGDFAGAGYHGGGDAFVATVNATGTVQWATCIGGSGQDQGFSILETTDGGFILAGRTNSSDGNFAGSGYHEGYDAFVAKVNATGTVQWATCIGGSDTDDGWGIEQTADGGYILAGYAYSGDGDFAGTAYHGGGDAFAAGINTTGAIEWVRCIGGSEPDLCFSIQQTTDGGFILAGRTKSSDGDFAGAGYHGDGTYEDAFIGRVNATGTVQWVRCIGGFGQDGGVSIDQTNEGGFILAGWTASSDGNFANAGYYGDYDAFVARVSATGTVQLVDCIGGSGLDLGYSILPTMDNRFILSGQATSSDGDFANAGLYGGYDAFVATIALPGGYGTGVFRPSAWDNWILDCSMDGSIDIRDHYGSPTDKPLIGDFNNDGAADRALFRAGDWILDYGIDGTIDGRPRYGMNGDIPVVGDFNDDGIADRAIFRSGQWIFDYDSDSDTDVRNNFGTAGDIPLTGDFNNDGIPDRAVFRGSASENWIFDYSIDGTVDIRNRYGQPGDIPVTGDFNHDGITDRAVFRAGEWIIDYGMDGSINARPRFGQTGDIPLVWIC